ncbi:MAG: DUF2459 domain-containing protein [Alphaproteobacteria bacterium]|nr:DUF2459 domain-containing protein [Alphaproteobacteria bacterium]
MRRLWLIVAVLVVWPIGVAGAQDRVIEVVNLGWHTGIVLPVDAIDPAVLPEIRDLQGAGWIEFGWGDAAFYRDPDPDIATYLSAAFVDTPAVMHVVGLPVPPAHYFPKAEVVEVSLTDAEHDRLVAYLSGSFDRRGQAKARTVGKGLYPNSLFYDATGRFSLSNTCNTWVVRGLAHAGLPIDTTEVIQAGTVMRRLRAALEKPR